jgi:hypothetical protein
MTLAISLNGFISVSAGFELAVGKLSDELPGIPGTDIISAGFKI